MGAKCVECEGQHQRCRRPGAATAANRCQLHPRCYELKLRQHRPCDWLSIPTAVPQLVCIWTSADVCSTVATNTAILIHSQSTATDTYNKIGQSYTSPRSELDTNVQQIHACMVRAMQAQDCQRTSTIPRCNTAQLHLEQGGFGQSMEPIAHTVAT